MTERGEQTNPEGEDPGVDVQEGDDTEAQADSDDTEVTEAQPEGDDPGRTENYSYDREERDLGLDA